VNTSNRSFLCSLGHRLRPISPMFSKAEMDALKKDGGVRGFLDDFISCKDTVKQVNTEKRRWYREEIIN